MSRYTQVKGEGFWMTHDSKQVDIEYFANLARRDAMRNEREKRNEMRMIKELVDLEATKRAAFDHVISLVQQAYDQGRLTAPAWHVARQVNDSLRESQNRDPLHYARERIAKKIRYWFKPKATPISEYDRTKLGETNEVDEQLIILLNSIRSLQKELQEIIKTHECNQSNASEHSEYNAENRGRARRPRGRRHRQN
jgi:hypothetical protein